MKIAEMSGRDRLFHSYLGLVGRYGVDLDGREHCCKELPSS